MSALQASSNSLVEETESIIVEDAIVRVTPPSSPKSDHFDAEGPAYPLTGSTVKDCVCRRMLGVGQVSGTFGSTTEKKTKKR